MIASGNGLSGPRRRNPPGLPPAKILGDRFLRDGFAKQHPGFVGAFGRDADFRKLTLRILGAVAAAKTEIKPHDGRADLEAGLLAVIGIQVLFLVALAFLAAFPG